MKTLKKYIKKLLGIKPPNPDSELRIRLDAFFEEYNKRALPEKEKSFKTEIIIPCHNHAQYLIHTIPSLVSLPVEVTVVDDASGEDDQKILEGLVKKYSFNLIRNETNLLQYGSINKAVSLSKNSLFIVVNADDILLNPWVKYVEDCFHNYDVRLIGGYSVPFSVPNITDEYLVNNIHSITYAPNSQLLIHTPEEASSYQFDNDLNMTMTGCSFLKSAWDFVGGFWPKSKRVSPHDDRDFQMRVNSFFNVGVSPEVSSFYRQDSSTGKGTI